MASSSLVNKENFNMKAVKGSPEFYFTNNIQFPNSNYQDISHFTHPLVSNRFANHIHDLQSGITPISKTQPIIIVECIEGNRAVSGKDDKFCEIEITIFTENDVVILIEEGTFSQYLDKNEQNYYNIKIPDDVETNKNTRIYLDLTIVSGDYDIKITSYEGYEGDDSNNYYFPNKVFCYIKYDKIKTDNLKFNVEPKKNAYYIINYFILNQDLSEDRNRIDS